MLQTSRPCPERMWRTLTRELKNSGVEWIGIMPLLWEVVPSNMLFYNSSIKTEEGVQQLTASQKYGVISQNRFMQLETQTPVQKQNLNDLKKVSKGDFVISLRSFQGGIEIAQESGGITPAYTVLKERTSKTYDGYYKYLFKSEMYIQALRGTVLDTIRDGKAIRFSNFSMVPIILPPKDEQEEIALFLDDIVKKINMVVSETQQSIEDLNRYKNSLVSEIVTRGLNKNIEMKNSGVKWIGDVPIDWEMKMIGNFFSQVKDKNLDLTESNLLSLSYGNIVRRDINSSDGLLPENFSGYNIVQPSDIVLRMTDLQNDQKSLRTGLVMEKGIITSAYITTRNNNPNLVNSEYIRYLLHTFDIQKGFYGMGSGVRQNITYKDIKKLPIVVPPIEIQSQIVKFLSEKLTAVNDLVKEKGNIISELEQYKKSLIYEYITGKKEV